MIAERCIVFWQQRRSFPEHILFYRDGVSDSQYGMVYDEELPKIREGCEKGFSDLVNTNGIDLATWHPPSITLLVVGKRHHTRFFPSRDQGTLNRVEPTPPRGIRSQDTNLSAGLIIDHTVVDANRTSFFLQSHDSPQGTARSGHYVVIINETGYPLGVLQKIVSSLFPST